jgi:hypothetical protein
VAKQRGDRRFAGQSCGFRAILGDPCEVEVRDEVVRVGALEDDHLQLVVCVRVLNERDKVVNERRAEKVHRRRRDLGKQDPAVGVDLEGRHLDVPHPSFEHRQRELLTRRPHAAQRCVLLSSAFCPIEVNVSTSTASSVPYRSVAEFATHGRSSGPYGKSRVNPAR